MLSHVAMLVMMATLVVAGKFVYPGPMAQTTRRPSPVQLVAVTPRQVVQLSRIAPSSPTTTPNCPEHPPEDVTEDTLDRRCFEITDEEDFVSLLAGTDQQCRMGHVRMHDERCLMVVRVTPKKPPK